MRMYMAFMKKEFVEALRTYRAFILLILFLLFGFMNALAAKMMPDLLKSFMPEGMSMVLPTPTALDSWAQFFKNVSQMGLIIVVILFSGMVSNEFSRGTLINMLTKGLSRAIVIVSKFTAASILWTVSYGICIAVTYYYTEYFWSMDNVSNLFLSLSGLWAFGVFLIAALILGGILFKNHFGGLLFVFGNVVVMMLISIVPKLQRFNPMTLASGNMNLISKQMPVAEFAPAIGVCGCMISLYILLSILIFNKKQV